MRRLEPAIESEIVELLRRRTMSYGEIAQLLGVSRGTVSNVAARYLLSPAMKVPEEAGWHVADDDRVRAAEIRAEIQKMLREAKADGTRCPTKACVFPAVILLPDGKRVCRKCFLDSLAAGSIFPAHPYGGR